MTDDVCLRCRDLELLIESYETKEAELALTEHLGACIGFDYKPVPGKQRPELHVYVRFSPFPVDDRGQAELVRHLCEGLPLLEIGGWEVDIRSEPFEVQTRGGPAYPLVVELRPPQRRHEGPDAYDPKQEPESD